MAENNALTKREIFEQIKILQKELLENPLHCLNGLTSMAETLCENKEYREEDEEISEISEVCTVFAMREETFQNMIKFYEKMYDDIIKA